MIQYSISKKRLENLIEQEKPGWLARAEKRTNHFKNLGHYNESSSIWSEVKKVFVRIQHGKCAYCERQLESEEYGTIEHDLEHFRPKKKAKPWKLNSALKQAGVVLTQPVSRQADAGYHLLAYNPLNYCTSCKTCNSRLKSDFFPIEGPRSSNGNDPMQLASEKPLLVNPVGDIDDAPESLLAFNGLSPFACGNTDYKIRRGLVSITFFKLDDHRRKYLFRERATVIANMYAYLELAENANTQEKKAIFKKLADTLSKPSSPHSNCAISFRKLYNQNRNEADNVFYLAESYLQTISS